MRRRLTETWPRGWYYCTEAAGVGDTPLPIRRFAQDLVVWRTSTGPVVSGAYCPHMGAHFGYGGTVVEDRLTCPFHAWRFSADGEHCDTPLGGRITNCRLQTYPAVERDGVVWMWYGSNHPEWELQDFAADHLGRIDTCVWEIAGPWRAVFENFADIDHFRTIHGMKADVVDEGPVVGQPSSYALTVDNHLDDVTNRMSLVALGPGVSRVSMTLLPSVQIGCSTPIDETNTVLYMLWRSDAAASSSYVDAIVEHFKWQIEQDLPIWEHMRYAEHPPIMENDAHLRAFKEWLEELYN